MKKIELIPGIKSSTIGFGCASILGAVDAKKSRRAIDVAIESGINHFDVARSYGYGDAERFLGQILPANRGEMVIATKFGIKANWKAKMLAPVKPAARMAMNYLKNRRGNAHPPAGNKAPDKNPAASQLSGFLDRVPITSKEMKQSVEISLRNLRTDYIDYLFVHEPVNRIANVEDVLYCAEKLKEEGKIRAFGLAYMHDQESLHRDYKKKFEILQFNNPTTSQVYEKLVSERSADPNIFFSVMKGGDVNSTPSQKLIRLSEDFPNSVLLCSMFNVEHIRSNSSLFT